MAKRKRRSGVGEFLYWLRYRIGEFFLRAFVRLFPAIPRSLLRLLTAVGARLTFMVFWKYRKRMEQNLAMAMGAEFPTTQTTRTIVRLAWRNFAQGMYETARAIHSSKEEISSAIALEGEEHLKRALERGKGVIALSAHLGSFTLIGARLAAASYPFSVVVKQPRDQRFGRVMDDIRLRVGAKTISAKPRREAAKKILQALRKNEIVLMIADEFKSRGIEVEFLGWTVAAPRGPATLALRSGASVVPMFVTRDRHDRLTLRIKPEITLAKTGDPQEDVARNLIVFTRELESMVRRYPEQWNWLGFPKDGKGQPLAETISRPVDPDRKKEPTQKKGFLPRTYEPSKGP